MAKRIYWESIKKWLIKHKISVSSLITGLFIFLVAYNLIDIISHSGDMICAGTEEDPCYAEITFLAKEDIFIYPIGYDPWGRETPFEFDTPLKDWKFYRSWGNYWREIDLTKGCTGSWCGCGWCTKSKLAKYSYVFRAGRVYTIRITGYKYNPYEDIKWSFGELDPWWYGEEQPQEIIRTANSDKSCIMLAVGRQRCNLVSYIGDVNIKDENGTYKPFTEVVKKEMDNDLIKLSYLDYAVWVDFGIVTTNDMEYNWTQLKTLFPNAGKHINIDKMRHGYKYGINITNIPKVYQNKVKYFYFRLEKAQGLTWGDVRKENGTIIIKEKIQFNYRDISEKFTLSQPDKRTVLIGNITANIINNSLFIDPTTTIYDIVGNAFDAISIDSDVRISGYSSTYQQEGVGAWGERYQGGMIWNLTDVPQGADINDAYMNLTPSNDPSGGATFGVEIQINDSANITGAGTAIFDDDFVGNISDHFGGLWSTSIPWTLTTWSDGVVEMSPNITTLIQHIVDKASYVQGNFIGIVVQNDSLPINANRYRAWNDYARTGQPSSILVVTWTSVADETAPTFSSYSANTTIAGQPVNFSVVITDETALSGYIFETNNSKGTFVNTTWTSLTSGGTAQNITTLNSTVGTIVNVSFYANDSSNNWGVYRSQLTTTSAIISTCSNFGTTGEMDCKDNCTNTTVTVAKDFHIFSSAGGILNLTDITIQGDLYENYTHSCYVYWYGYRNITGG